MHWILIVIKKVIHCSNRIKVNPIIFCRPLLEGSKLFVSVMAGVTIETLVSQDYQLIYVCKLHHNLLQRGFVTCRTCYPSQKIDG